MTIDEWLTDLRSQLNGLVKQYLDDGEDDAAMKVLTAVMQINAVRDHLADQGLADHEMLSATTHPQHCHDGSLPGDKP